MARQHKRMLAEQDSESKMIECTWCKSVNQSTTEKEDGVTAASNVQAILTVTLQKQ